MRVSAKVQSQPRVAENPLGEGEVPLAQGLDRFVEGQVGRLDSVERILLHGPVENAGSAEQDIF